MICITSANSSNSSILKTRGCETLKPSYFFNKSGSGNGVGCDKGLLSAYHTDIRMVKQANPGKTQLVWPSGLGSAFFRVDPNS